MALRDLIPADSPSTHITTPLPAMQVHVLGAGRSVGRSCISLRVNKAHVLLDCGAHPALSTPARFPDFTELSSTDPPPLDAVLITHFHLDHAAALPFLTETLGSRAPVYMTRPTRALAALMLSDFVATSIARGQYCPFTRTDAMRSLSRAHDLPLGVTTRVGPRNDVFVTPFRAGHTLGAVMLRIEVADARVLYTGDYTVRPGRHLQAAAPPYAVRPHLLISEATYCGAARAACRADRERPVLRAVLRAAAHMAKILIPVSAFGRVQEVCAVFAACPQAELLHAVPMYLVSGLASRANHVYAQFNESPSGEDCPFLARLRHFNMSDHGHLLHERGSMILFATPGTMSTGISRDVFRLWSGNTNNLVVVPGFSLSNTLASHSTSPSDNALDSAQAESQVKCRLVNMSYNSHADARGIVRTCRKLMPYSIMLVHGEETKVLAFRKQLQDAFQVKCYAPNNGDKLSIPILPDSCLSPWVVGPPTPRQHLPTHWQNLIDQYLRTIGQRNNSSSA